MKKFHIFDLDDTLRLGLNSKFLKSGEFENQIVLPNVAEKLKELKTSGEKLFIASNQGFPSFGEINEDQIWKGVNSFNESELNGLIDDIKLSFYHPKGNFKDRYENKRKPKPDMVLELLEDYKISKKEVAYIGNAPSDEETALNAGIEFIWAHDFFGWDKRNLFIDEKFGYRWDLEKLKEEYEKNPEILKRLEKFIELSDKSIV